LKDVLMMAQWTRWYSMVVKATVVAVVTTTS
jgi:hypothetical protein